MTRAHTPVCPLYESRDHDTARTMAAHPQQGWCVRCTSSTSWGAAKVANQ
ncbi:DUF5999 family protein [Streptomyces albipurpureus]